MRALALLLLLASAPAPSAAPGDPTGMRHLYLVRHGMYDRDETVDDRLGNGLNALGREQARLLGSRLAALPTPVSTLVSSDLTRARETAAELGRALGVAPTQDELLRECVPASDGDRRPAGGAEAATASCDRQLAAAWERYARPAAGSDARDVLVCHGNVIRWLAMRAVGGDTRRWKSLDIGNASLSVISVAPDGSTRLLTFSDVGHLPPPLQTWTGRGPGWLAAPAQPRAAAPAAR